MGKKSKASYPALDLKKRVIFPSEKVSLVMEGEEAAEAVKKAHEGSHLLAVLFERDDGRSEIGMVARVTEHWKLTDSIIGFILEGQKRVRVIREFREGGGRMAEVAEITEEEKGLVKEATEIEALARAAFEQLKKILQVEGIVPMEMIEDLQKEYLPPEKTSDLISAALRLDYPEKLQLLEMVSLKDRLEILNQKLAKEQNVVETEKKIQANVEQEVESVQKEYVLRERLKAIEKELGIYEEQKEYDDLEQKLKAAQIPEQAGQRAINELYRLRRLPQGSAEIPYVRTYLEWVADLPWSRRKETKVDLKKAREVLDEDHYGLKKAKERVLEYLAVNKLTGGKGRATILCFVGPPGTGKTSVGQSIARSVGRDFVRISLGGIRDEAEIRGHRRTYVGALPGRIIQGIRNAGTKNPVFMMDEVDKIGLDFRGDPSAALLEVLDPAQNHSFSDHYIEIPFDLSEVFFITTANILEPIPPALQDRMEVIEFPGYTDEEKFHIAQKFLLPRVLKETGVGEDRLVLDNEALYRIIGQYTREAGVRELERKLAEISRKVALGVAQGEIKNKIKISPDNLVGYLGPEEYEKAVKEEADEVGVATGLAWTPAGGEIIFIESNMVPGKGNLTLTGQLGETMQESAKAALSYARSKWKDFKIPEDFYYQFDVHIHVPSGATHKDGPSAGTAIAVSLASMLAKKKVRREVAMTGEITLCGKVLKIGGVKEKVLAAHRAGIETIVLPQENKNSLMDIPEEIKKDLQFKFVNHMDEVLKIALNT